MADTGSIVAVHGIFEDDIQTWTDPTTNVFWLRDLLSTRLPNCRVLNFSYQVAAFTSPSVDSSKSILTHAQNLVAELYADRHLENASNRPIIFVCHGFGGILVKRALAFSQSRVNPVVEHLRSIFTCTYGVLFFGTPHAGVYKDAIFLQHPEEWGPSHFMISLITGSEILDEINDQFAPLMKQFSIYNFWETIKTSQGVKKFYVVDQDSAAPLWDDVEKCGMAATHSTMTKFEGLADRKFQLVLEALSRYSRLAPALIRSRIKQDADLMSRKCQQEVDEMLQSQRQSLAHVDATSPYHNQWSFIPRKSSAYFTRRQKHANEVQNKLGTIRRYDRRCKCKILVIYGLGGSGKTQFCLKYAEDNKHRYWGVSWIDASSEKSVESGFAFIGTHFGRGATMASALHWLSQCKEPWLLILDNADDPDVDISAYYPSEGNGHVIITTRNPNTVEFATAGHLRFRGMEPHEAISLLLKAAYPDPQQFSNPSTPGKWQLAEGIAIELGYLPLAIAHAGATIRRNIYTLERYLKYYLPQRKAMLSHSRLKSVDEINIITTWEIPFQKIVGRASVEHRDAVDLMHTFAFMHHETIPERIFQRSWDILRSPRSPLKTFPDVFQPVWSEGAQARLRRAIRILCDHSIIEYEPSKGSCTMHPVVHNWARDRLGEAEQTRWLRCTMAILAHCIASELEASGRQFRALLLPHINSCLQLHRSESLQNRETIYSATEMERFAKVYAEQGQWETALELQDKVLLVRKKLLGKRHEDTIRIQRSLGHSLWNLFKIKEAVGVQKEILDLLRWNRQQFAEWAIWPIWEPIHVPYCVALSDITLTLWLAGHRQLSERTGKRAVDGLTKRLGTADPCTLNAMFNLARTYFHVGKEQKSHEILVWVLRIQKRFFGMDHPDTLMTRNKLGMLLCASKRHLNAAKVLVENVLKARKRILGEEHAYTLWSVNDLSKIYVEMGRSDDAITMLENIIPIVTRTLGDHHAGMSMTRSNLGKAYFLAERWKEAEDTVRPLLAVVPAGHPDGIHNRYGYAHILFNLGRLVEAEKHCVEIISMVTQEKTISLSDSRTVATADLLMAIYQQQGQEEKAVSLCKTIPGTGLVRNEDRFDPYAVRRGSSQPPSATDRRSSAARSRHESSPKQPKVSLAPRHGLQAEGPSPRLIARHTF